jgi:Arc/MetJ family transcription regulator
VGLVGYLTTLSVMRLCSFDDGLISCVIRRTELLSERSVFVEGTSRREVRVASASCLFSHRCRDSC